MRRLLVMALCAAASASPALARDQDKPITQREPDAVDVATTPATDLNLRKEEIPQLLIDAQSNPYGLSGLSRCGALVAEVEKFDQVLGPDLDLPQQERNPVSAGRVAKSVVGSFIPFRGIVREISGANDQDRKVKAAIEAGLTRRGFLKGVGQTKGCRYPARAASRSDVDAFLAQQKAEREAADREKEKDKDKKGKSSGKRR
ncbi:MAG: hypothetical protein KDE55_19965 [Novosphingobium sp.]|nr:hypothetical protein [Novosphingobium sp.]